MNFFKKIKKLIRFIIYEDSLLGDLLFVLIFLVLLKFIVLPFLSLILGTPLPIVIVMSNSMEHTCFNPLTYQKYNITPEDMQTWPFREGISVGDVIISVKPENIKVGDVVIYYSPFGFPIIHRVVGIIHEDNRTYYIIKGDNNKGPIRWNFIVDENKMPKEKIIGKAVYRIPKIGLVKVYFIKLLCVLNVYDRRACYYLNLAQISNC